jgi:hypothetical protein
VAYQNFTYEPDWTPKETNKLGPKTANGLNRVKHIAFYSLERQNAKTQLQPLIQFLLLSCMIYK